MHRFVLPLVALTALTGCDVATEMAGEAIKGEVRTRYLEQCQGIAESAGIAAENITRACECSADNFETDLATDGQLDISSARVEEMVRSCMQDGPDAVPAEGTNG